MALRIPVADEAVAKVAITKLLEQVLASEVTTEPKADSMASKILEAASRVQFQPSTRRLVLSFDLGMTPEED
jgi:hypothetical protein